MMTNNKSFLRNVIGEYMTHLGDIDSNVVVVNADLAGTCRNKSFIEKYPIRSFNTGIAEQNMVSFGAGLALEGFTPYVFSMAPFLTMRACEQCRTDVAYANANVRMIGIYAGLSGGISGATHWAIEDVGIMTSIPNIAVFEVSDVTQTKMLFDYSLNYKGPMYIRCSVVPTFDVYKEDIEIKSGGSLLVKDGADGTILCSGVTVQYALEAAIEIENEYSKSIRVIDLYSLKPIDEQAVISAASTGNVIVAHDHNIYGGLGSLVSTVLSKNSLNPKFKILGLNDSFVPMAHADYLYRQFELDKDGIKKNMLNMLGV